MSPRLAFVTAFGLVVACAGPYAERPPSSTERTPGSTERETSTPAAAESPGDPEPESPAGDPAEETTLTGYVTPDGRFHPDTGSAAPDPAPVDRRTVVTGTLRTAPPVEAPGATGFRVQVFAARDHGAAAGVARRLEARLEGQPVHVERADRWYKVQVGDLATREEAERLRARLVEMGYAEAWTTRATIRTQR